MKIAVVFFPESETSSLRSFAEAVAQGIQAQGKEAEVLQGYKDTVRPGMFSYICIVGEAAGLFSRKPVPRLGTTLASMTGLSGKRVSLVLRGNGIFSDKLAQETMKVLESQGLFLRNHLVAKNAEACTAFAQHLNVELLPRVQ